MLHQTELDLGNINQYSRMNIRLEITHTQEIDNWIAEHHYLKSTPAMSMIRMVFKDRQGNLLGAMLWNKPTARKSDQEHILELTRMYFINETERMVESHCLGLARKHIRKHFPKVRGLLAFSSTGQGHEGTIYEADNWFMVQVSKVPVSGWETRQGRENRDLSDKIKWMRSP